MPPKPLANDCSRDGRAPVAPVSQCLPCFSWLAPEPAMGHTSAWLLPFLPWPLLVFLAGPLGWKPDLGGGWKLRGKSSVLGEGPAGIPLLATGEGRLPLFYGIPAFLGTAPPLPACSQLFSRLLHDPFLRGQHDHVR